MILALLLSGLAFAATPLSLTDCYKAALVRSETFGIEAAQLREAEELETQARATLFPVLSANATFLRQDTPTPAVARAQDTVRVTGSQSLFRGFREISLLRQRGALRSAQEAALADAGRILFYDVADAFYGVLALQADILSFGNELELGRKRLREVEGFRRVGRSRASDLLSQRALIASLEAQVEATRAQLKIQRDVLAFLTGLPAESPLRDVEKAPSRLVALDTFLARVPTRADISASSYSVLAADQAVSAVRGLHWPTADLLGNYYLQRPAGTSRDVRWDVSLVLSLPLFQGGSVASQVRGAVAVQEQAVLAESRARRLADQEVRRFYERVKSGQVQLEKLTELADISRQNHEALRRDFGNGLVTNLDVLQATNSWHISLRSRERQAILLVGDWVKLQAAGGERAEVGGVK